MSDFALPSIKTFDLTAILQGRSYPEVEVPFYLDEAAALELTRKDRQMTRHELLAQTEEAEALAKEIEALKEQIRNARYVCHLRGVPNKIRRDLLKKALEKYPREHDLLRAEIESPERDEMFTELLWHAMITKIESPDGAIQENLTLEAVRQMRDMLPDAASAAIQTGVNELSMGAKAGFESAVQDSDFLSQP